MKFEIQTTSIIDVLLKDSYEQLQKKGSKFHSDHELKTMMATACGLFVYNVLDIINVATQDDKNKFYSAFVTLFATLHGEFKGRIPSLFAPKFQNLPPDDYFTDRISCFADIIKVWDNNVKEDPLSLSLGLWTITKSTDKPTSRIDSGVYEKPENFDNSIDITISSIEIYKTADSNPAVNVNNGVYNVRARPGIVYTQLTEETLKPEFKQDNGNGEYTVTLSRNLTIMGIQILDANHAVFHVTWSFETKTSKGTRNPGIENSRIFPYKCLILEAIKK